MKKVISLVLVLATLVTTLLVHYPPLEILAATSASISSPSVSPKQAYEGESVQVKGTVKSGSYYLRAIQIEVRNEGDDSHGFKVDRVEFSFSKKQTSYSLSNLDEFDIGSYYCTGCKRTEYLEAGEHRIDIHVGLYDSKGNTAEGFTKSIWFEVIEEEPPYIKDIDADVDGAEVEFTVKTNLTAKYGIALYADEYRLDKIAWKKSTYSSYIKYTGSYVFNLAGEREITVYALDEDGDIVDDSDDSITVNITSLGRCDTPKITTANNQKIEVGNSFTVAWSKPTSPSGVTFKYNVYVYDGKTNTLVGEGLTATSYTIPASKLSKAGTYVISVIATAKNYTQSNGDNAAINLIVTEKQETPDLSSVSATVNVAKATFTVKGNADAKYGIVMYADEYKLDTISWSKSGSSTITYTGSHTFNLAGERTITVYALDKNGNEVSGSKVTTTVNITSLGRCDTPKITTANNQKIEVGNSFTVAWSKPTSPSGVTFKYNVYVYDGKTNTLVGEGLTATSYTIPASKLSKAGTYVISVIATAKNYTQSNGDNAAINLNVVAKETVEKTTLTTPRVSGSSKIQYGDDYTISWDFDAQVDYYQITIDGLNYKKTVSATEKSFTIPGSVFKQYSGANVNYTIYLVAMSTDTEKYLPSEAATIRVNIAGYSESNALIKSAEILNGNEIIAGTIVQFKVITTKDVTTLRMKDGAGSFIVNTWYASEIGTNSSKSQYYKDSGNDRIWYIQQKVNHAGDANATGAKRLLTFYSMVNEVEYNNCSVSFYCKKGNDVIGKFEITSPSNNAVLSDSKDVVITWSAPANTTVDYYIIDIYHGDTRVDRATVTKPTYTLSASLLEKDNVVWQICVTARKDEGQWAESATTATFKLECTHEHLGQAKETVLSYAKNNATVHSCVIEKVSSCLDCGLSNAKKVQETVTRSHNWVVLDKGGKVCNQCWYLQSDGTFPVKNNMQLSSIASNREFVYFNVDASGEAANKQNGRYVEKGDIITVLGEVRNCYLIEYPISSGVHWGFLDSDLVCELNATTSCSICGSINVKVCLICNKLKCADCVVLQYYETLCTCGEGNGYDLESNDSILLNVPVFYDINIVDEYETAQTIVFSLTQVTPYRYDGNPVIHIPFQLEKGENEKIIEFGVWDYKLGEFVVRPGADAAYCRVHKNDIVDYAVLFSGDNVYSVWYKNDKGQKVYYYDGDGGTGELILDKNGFMGSISYKKYISMRSSADTSKFVSAAIDLIVDVKSLGSKKLSEVIIGKFIKHPKDFILDKLKDFGIEWMFNADELAAKELSQDKLIRIIGDNSEFDVVCNAYQEIMSTGISFTQFCREVLYLKTIAQKLNLSEYSVSKYGPSIYLDKNGKIVNYSRSAIDYSEDKYLYTGEYNTNTANYPFYINTLVNGFDDTKSFMSQWDKLPTKARETVVLQLEAVKDFSKTTITQKVIIKFPDGYRYLLFINKNGVGLLLGVNYDNVYNTISMFSETHFDHLSLFVSVLESEVVDEILIKKDIQYSYVTIWGSVSNDQVLANYEILQMSITNDEAEDILRNICDKKTFLSCRHKELMVEKPARLAFEKVF